MTRIISNLSSTDFCFQSAGFSARLLAKADQALYQQLYCSQQVMQYIGKPLTAAQANASFNAALKHNDMASEQCYFGCRVFLVLVDTVLNQYSGLFSASLQPLAAMGLTEGRSQQTRGPDGKFEAELGIMLFPSAKKRGGGQAAIRGLCQKLRGQPKLYGFTFCTATNNFAAKKLVSRLGFVYCENRNCYQLLK